MPLSVQTGLSVSAAVQLLVEPLQNSSPSGLLSPLHPALRSGEALIVQSHSFSALPLAEVTA